MDEWLIFIGDTVTGTFTQVRVPTGISRTGNMIMNIWGFELEWETLLAAGKTYDLQITSTTQTAMLHITNNDVLLRRNWKGGTAVNNEQSCIKEEMFKVPKQIAMEDLYAAFQQDSGGNCEVYLKLYATLKKVSSDYKTKVLRRQIS